MIGVGLSASCGFRVFVPMLVMGIAVRAGTLQLSEGWHWMGSLPALGMFGLATFCEVAGYCIPWLDNVLDTAASPAAVVAGIVATAGCVSRWNDPAAQWAVAIIAGGAAAGLIQTGTVLVQGHIHDDDGRAFQLRGVDGRASPLGGYFGSRGAGVGVSLPGDRRGRVFGLVPNAAKTPRGTSDDTCKVAAPMPTGAADRLKSGPEWGFMPDGLSGRLCGMRPCLMG